MKEQPHIRVDYPYNFSDRFETDVRKDFDHEALDIKFVKQEPTAWAALEWVIPGAISIYILKTYFDAFLKEAGKDHYHILKKKLNEVMVNARSLGIKNVASDLSPNKLDKSNTQSPAISIFVQCKNGTIVKLLYDETLDVDVWQQATESFLNIVTHHFESDEENQLTAYLAQFETPPQTIYAIIDNESHNWILINNISAYMRNKK